MNITLYFRGSLTSCNYSCPYCPFSKNVDNATTLAKDRQQLAQFVQWVVEQEHENHRFSIFFNPYGEGLIHRWYREAMVTLSHLPHVNKVAIQTNLSAPLDWTTELNRETVAFWATYHPGQVSEERFLERCLTLHKHQIPFSVGTVGLKGAIPAIASLRSLLPEEVCLWVNAFKDLPAYYNEQHKRDLSQIDPTFALNLEDYPSFGRACAAGEQVFYVQGSGIVKRCYKDRRVIGHLYRDGIGKLSRPRPCQMNTCDCYIGYIHMPELELDKVYGSSKLERIVQQ